MQVNFWTFMSKISTKEKIVPFMAQDSAAAMGSIKYFPHFPQLQLEDKCWHFLCIKKILVYLSLVVNVSDFKLKRSFWLFLLKSRGNNLKGAQQF